MENSREESESVDKISRDELNKLVMQVQKAASDATAARGLSEKILVKETWQVGFVTVIVAVAAFVSGYSVIDKSREVEASARRAEALVQEAIGNTKPKRVSSLSPASVVSSGGMRLSYYLEPQHLRKGSWYTLVISADFKGQILGPTSSLIGAEWSVGGQLASFVATDIYGNSMQTVLDTQTVAPRYSAIDPIPVAQDGKFEFSVTFNRRFLTCEEATSAMDAFISAASPDFGKITVRPIFEFIEESRGFDFDIEAFERDGLVCHDWTAFLEQ